MFIKDGVYRNVDISGLTAPILEGTVLTATGAIAAADGSDAFGIVPENVYVMPPTKMTRVAIGGTIDMQDPANKDIDFTENIIKALGQDINFIPAAEAARAKLYVYPEDFGAKGDGTTYDTTALQNAADYARANGKVLSAKNGKTYITSALLDFSGIDVFFNGATIKSGNIAHNYLIKVDSSTRENGDKSNIIRDLTIDCANLSGGIDYIVGNHDVLFNVNIINCNQTGIVIRSGGGVHISNCYLMGTAATTTTGIIMLTSDCHVEQTTIKDMHVAINNTGTNLYTCVHSWMSKNFDDTICFLHNSGNVVMVQCHFDTSQKAIYRNTDANIDLIGCIYYMNSVLWDSDQTPYIVFGVEANFPYSANVHFIGCSFNPLNTAVTLTNIPYNRFVFKSCFFKDGITGNVNNVLMTLSNKVSISDDWAYVKLRQEEKEILIDALLAPTAELTTGYAAVMTIPTSYMFPANDAGTGYNARGHAILSLDAVTASETMIVGASINPNNGIISLNIPTSLTVSRIKCIEIHFAYKAKKSLDYYRG